VVKIQSLGAITPVFNEEKLIKGCIKSVENVVSRHIVLSATNSLYGDQVKTDKTSELAEALGATVVDGSWDKEHEQRNLGVAMVKDCPWILCLDADMWFSEKYLNGLLKFLETTRFEAVVSPQWAYWSDTDHVLYGDDFMPVVAIRPNVRFTNIGCVNVPFAVYNEKIDHLNWCKPKDILKKVLTYSHRPDYEEPADWFYKKFCTWQPGDKAVMPDGKEFDVVYKPLSRELRRYLD
jgi:glycosyltransferase involved in cell wall biosynthesis